MKMNPKASQPTLHHPFIGEKRSEGGRSSVFNKSINLPAAQAPIGIAPGLSFHLMRSRESLNYFFTDWGNIPRLKQSISIIYKNNSDIGHPWIETWRLYWINAQALLLTSASSSHPWVALAFYAQKGNPPQPPTPFPSARRNGKPGLGTHTHAQSFIINRVRGRVDPC